ncbi:Gpb2p KNAG_0E04180 [Huiozyma naganishii CBS 8797]|uniref:Uncharacterized protein n=1 Tax=Huiozyma naganishii (strain ATCC MYA-139 / BCRC 22969 / CBS 8797 / KCTC 17520 / NBRC 10181 / NCYC 3082 / Yp74L-3) TaxID=1071383 RepID=J7S836_HUIN7|nr:hypothetical protein KNAG_0E04180 [Kazachstania naganishii CBS 8797]CCK70671.1 hypothetical protein KNAG_0E04180 [Kazachstania naganishii CBS 8797]
MFNSGKQSDMRPLNEYNVSETAAVLDPTDPLSSKVEYNDQRSCMQSMTKVFRPLPYFSNYYAIMDVFGNGRKPRGPLDFSNLDSSRSSVSSGAHQATVTPLEQSYFNSKIVLHSKQEIESLLKRFYMTTRCVSVTSGRNSSVVSSQDSQKQYVGDRKANLVDDFLSNPSLPWITYENPFEPAADRVAFDRLPFISDDMIDKEASASYFKYMAQLQNASHDVEVLKRHNLWIPAVNPIFNEILMKDTDSDGGLQDKKTKSPYFINGEGYIPKMYDTFAGTTFIPSVFSECKVPSFVYHCSVPLDDNIYIIGGSIPSYRYDEEAPNLNEFEMDGIEYLPPPLLNDVINNPSMLGNPYLYVISSTTNHVSRPKIFGHIPPILHCATGSKLSDRYILYFGGFEVRTEAMLNQATGKYHLKKKAFVNNVGYILDVMTYKFSKMELLLEPNASNGSLEKLTNFPPRFGHAQMSLDESAPGQACKISPTCQQDDTSLKHGGVNRILIFGGYKQVGDDEYEAMNDLWQVDIPIKSRGKRGFIKFSKTATAKLISQETVKGLWPPQRAFMGALVYDDVPYANYNDIESEMLSNLAKNFEVSSSLSRGGQSSDFKPADDKYGCVANSTPSKTCKRSFIIHGGSNNAKVYGDLWWFDLQKLKWEKIELFGKYKQANGDVGLKSIELRLVGHTILASGTLLTFVGGLNQDDVNILFNNEEVDSPVYGILDYESMESIELEQLTIRAVDLSTQCIFFRELIDDDSKDDKVARVKVRSRMDAFPSMYFGSTFLVCQDTVLLIGGLYVRRSNVRQPYLRGTMLHTITQTIRFAL